MADAVDETAAATMSSDEEDHSGELSSSSSSSDDSSDESIERLVREQIERQKRKKKKQKEKEKKKKKRKAPAAPATAAAAPEEKVPRKRTSLAAAASAVAAADVGFVDVPKIPKDLKTMMTFMRGVSEYTQRYTHYMYRCVTECFNSLQNMCVRMSLQLRKMDATQGVMDKLGNRIVEYYKAMSASMVKIDKMHREMKEGDPLRKTREEVQSLCTQVNAIHALLQPKDGAAAADQELRQEIRDIKAMLRTLCAAQSKGGSPVVAEEVVNVSTEKKTAPSMATPEEEEEEEDVPEPVPLRLRRLRALFALVSGCPVQHADSYLALATTLEQAVGEYGRLPNPAMAAQAVQALAKHPAVVVVVAATSGIKKTKTRRQRKIGTPEVVCCVCNATCVSQAHMECVFSIPLGEGGTKVIMQDLPVTPKSTEAFDSTPAWFSRSITLESLQDRVKVNTVHNRVVHRGGVPQEWWYCTACMDKITISRKSSSFAGHPILVADHVLWETVGDRAIDEITEEMLVGVAVEDST